MLLVIISVFTTHNQYNMLIFIGVMFSKALVFKKSVIKDTKEESNPSWKVGINTIDSESLLSST